MTTKEIRERSTDAIEHELKDQQKHLFDLRSQAVTEKLEDPSQLLKVRRDIARMKTILRQRQLDDQPKAQRQSKQQRKSTSTSETKA